MEKCDVVFLAILYVLSHPLRMLYIIYDRKRFRRKVVELVYEVINIYNKEYSFTHKELDSYKIGPKVEYWLNTHNLDYYNKGNRFVVESCVQTIFSEIEVKIFGEDIEDVKRRIGEICSKMYSPLNKRDKKSTSWYKSFLKNIRNVSLKDIASSLFYLVLLVAIIMLVRMWFIDLCSHRFLSKFALKEAEASIFKADSILKSALEDGEFYEYDYMQVHEQLNNALFRIQPED